MANRARYEASWVPGFNTDFDPDDALGVGFAWLRAQQKVLSRVVVMNGVNMASDPPLAELAAGFPVLSPRTRRPAHVQRPCAVLAIYPAGDALELAETLALNGALCVIPGTILDPRPWIIRSSATNIVAPDSPLPELDPLPKEVTAALDYMASFGGHNGFLGGGEKDDAVRHLRGFVADGHRPEPSEVELYLLATGSVRPGGAKRVREWYEAILAGRRLRGESGRSI